MSTINRNEKFRSLTQNRSPKKTDEEKRALLRQFVRMHAYGLRGDALRKRTGLEKGQAVRLAHEIGFDLGGIQ